MGGGFVRHFIIIVDEDDVRRTHTLTAEMVGKRMKRRPWLRMQNG